MNRFLPFILGVAATLSASAEVTFNIYNHVTFFDGYLVDKIPETAPDEDCSRIFTYLVTKPLTDDMLDALGETLRLDVQVFALCDNYDRIGSVNLALLPKGQQSYTINYDESDPLRMEIARFITPFMDKNKTPNSISYSYDLDYLSRILRDTNLRNNYDFWLEFMIFGVPYDANINIAGCADCNEVFQGSVDLVTDTTVASAVTNNVVVPIAIRTAEWRADRGLNNYNAACTDEVGRTIKTFTYTVPEDCSDGRVVLVMSNHGAGFDGEEYYRRDHYIYADGDLKLQFKPGRVSCEPFRQYNTQTNSIYGAYPRTDEKWQSFSNWCPGDVIDNRFVELGAVDAGEHTITIDVPDAVFFENDGYFPVSLYFQGVTDGSLTSVIQPIEIADYVTSVSVKDGILNISSPEGLEAVSIFTIGGQCIFSTTCSSNSTDINVSNYEHGVYAIVVNTPSVVEVHKFAF